MGKIDPAKLYKRNYTNAEGKLVMEAARENFASV